MAQLEKAAGSDLKARVLEPEAYIKAKESFGHSLNPS